MRSAQSLADLEAGWTSYLSELNKVWLHVEMACKVVSRFQPWQGKVAAQRKADELLSYLRHARNAHVHTLADPVATTPGQVTLQAHDRPAVVQNLRVYADGHVEFDGDGILRVEFRPGRIEVLPVVDRGKQYPPPTSHLGQSFARRDPVALAEAGLAFYTSFVESAETEFFPAGG